MAQRGGFVKAQLRLGRENVGPNIPQRGADMVIAMEQSESLKAIPFIKPGGDFVLYGDIWAPTAVSLWAKLAYPTFDQIKRTGRPGWGASDYIDPGQLPSLCRRTGASEPLRPGRHHGPDRLGGLAPRKMSNKSSRPGLNAMCEANLFAYRAGLNLPAGRWN